MPETPPSQPVPSRQLVLHVMLSLLMAVGVFVVLSWLVIVPQLAKHEVRVRALEAQVAQLQEDVDEATSGAEPAPAPSAVIAEPPPPAKAAAAAPAPPAAPAAAKK
jgi:hypothetical protein